MPLEGNSLLNLISYSMKLRETKRNISKLKKKELINLLNEAYGIINLYQDLLKDFVNLVYDPATNALSEEYYRYKKREFINHYLNNGGLFVLMDVDNLKKINSEYGYIMGDKYLKNAAKKIINAFSKKFGPWYLDLSNFYHNYIFARRGGDEFVVIIPQSITGENLENSLYKMKEIENHLSKGEGIENPPITMAYSFIDRELANTYVKDPSDLITGLSLEINKKKLKKKR